MNKLARVAVGIFAVIGAIVVAFYISMKVLVSHECEQEVLSRALSPNGMIAAQHVRRTCDSGTIMEDWLEFVPAKPGAESSSVGQLIFRAESPKDQEITISIKPFRLWWVAEDKLHVEYPRSVGFSSGGKIGTVRVEEQSF